MQRLVFLLVVLIVFSSCEKEELPVLPHDSGDIVSQQIELGQDYRYQVFYDLGTNVVVSQNLKTDWDLGFESSNQGYHIILNSSTYSALSYVEDNSFDDIIATNNLDWFWDNPNGVLDSTAFGDYRALDGFFVIDRGYNIDGSLRGYKKIIIDSVTTEHYLIRYANLDNSDLYTLQVDKNVNVNFTSFSFSDNAIVNIEPNSSDWDLLFSQYTHLYSDTTIPSYLVMGVLSNNLNIAIDTVNNFEDISYDMISNYMFNNDRDNIGFNWKEYDLTAGEYTVFPEINYIIQDVELKYYKLHFLDFYNNQGIKGYPKFEVQEL